MRIQECLAKNQDEWHLLMICKDTEIGHMVGVKYK